MFKLLNRVTVNWHLEKDCNYKCKFCYAHFSKIKNNLDLENGFKLIDEIKLNNVYKINFAGGEPLLNNNVGEFIRYANHIGLKTSIISNGTKITNTWLMNYGRYLNQIGISCDSLVNHTNTELGRGFGNHVQITERVFSRINKLNKYYDINIYTKLNAVILRQNYLEDWNRFVIKNNIDRFKVLKILKIDGENDHVYHELSITDSQFETFLNNHKLLIDKKILIKENNDDMENSYIMISPDGRFYQNHNNKYIYSDYILDVGFYHALINTGFSYDKFTSRGGNYDL